MKEFPQLIFFHGLNTYGDADAHIGPRKLGAMAKNWRSRLETLYPEIEFRALSAMGSQSLSSQAASASRELELLLTSLNRPLHFIGQSTGGLVARQVAAMEPFKSRVRSIITVGTPHHGAAAAEFAIKVSESANLLKPLAKSIGYDVDGKTRIFRELTRQGMAEFNVRFPSQETAPCYSIPCVITRDRVAWPLQILYSWIHQISPGPSDGFVSLASQIFSPEINASLAFPLETCELDHYSELGYGLALRPKDRLRAGQSFDRLIDTVVRIVSSRSDLVSYR